MACLRENSIRWTSPSLHSSALRVLSSSSSPETKIGRRRTKKKEKRRKKAATTAAAEEEEGAKKYVTLRSTSSRRDDVLYSIFPLLLLLLVLMTSILRWRSSYDHYKERSIKRECVCVFCYSLWAYSSSIRTRWQKSTEKFPDIRLRLSPYQKMQKKNVFYTTVGSCISLFLDRHQYRRGKSIWQRS